MDILNQIPVSVLAVIPVLPIVAYFVYIQMWASKISNESQEKKVPLPAGQLAQKVLKSANVENVPVEKWDDHSSSSYDSSQKKVFLSPKIYEEKDVFSVTTAIEKAGLAIFDAHKPQILGLWKVSTFVFTLLYWTIAFMLPCGAFLGNMPVIIASYVLLAIALVLYCYNAAVKKMFHSNVLHQLGQVESIDQNALKDVQKTLKAISLAW